MALDFQQVREQVKKLGENAPLREQRLQKLRDQACELLKSNAQDQDRLRRKIEQVAQIYDQTLRCAVPASEPLDAHFALPVLPPQVTILAADGSQIAPDRHAEVDYCLINVGAIEMRHGSSNPPKTTVDCHLFYDEELFTPTGTITEATLALMRDLNERTMLVKLAERAPAPVITFTDGPMELLGGKNADGESTSEFQKRLEAYRKALLDLCRQGVTTAGYVDKPSSNLVVRLLEVALLTDPELRDVKRLHPLRGVTDFGLYSRFLESGERSAVFGIQSISAVNYQDELALHFFYLNVGRLGHPWLARVEIPAWVAENPEMLDLLHAALIQQCRIMGTRTYPYLLHRAHEAAVVSLEEKAQVTQMIALELRRQGVPVGEQSQKQGAKSFARRTSFKG